MSTSNINIWTYGCSLTAGYEELKLTDKVWPHHLDIGIPFNVINRANVGKSFYDASQKLLNDIGNIKKNDLVIFQLTFSHRLYLPYFTEEYDSYRKVRDWHLPKGNPAWFQYMKESDGLDFTLKEESLVLFRLMNRLGIKFMWWTLNLYDDTILEEFIDNKLSIEKEPCYLAWVEKNYKIHYRPNDMHVNEDGHKLIAQSFSPQIINYLNIKETPIKKNIL